MTATVVSSDGTTIAYQQIGRGPALILIDGALCYRKLGQTAQLAESLSQHFTVFTYDRRGRGESGDTAPYAVAREVDDIAALVDQAGGSVFVWGMSSGAVLALEAAKRIRGIKKVAVYEAPLIVDHSRPATDTDWARIRNAISANRRGEAVKTFLRSVGTPSFVIAGMRLFPLWSRLKKIAHTLPYDGAIVEEHQKGKMPQRAAWASVKAPTLVTDGGKSPQWMRNGNRALAEALPNARYETLPGQTHLLKAAAHASLLTEFFK